MIRHCSLWKFKDGTSRELIDEIVREWRALEEKIDCIRGAAIGADIGDAPENHDVVACIDFDSFEGYKEYRADETHLAFAMKYLMPNIEGLHKRSAIQFTLDIS